MLVDFNVSTKNLPQNADFCVVGSGPAGMTVAMQLEEYGRSVILLEGGGLDQSRDSQDIYKGDVIGDPYAQLDIARLRYLGGTSGHWGGWSYPLSENVFQKKDGFQDARWPIEKKDLDPFLGKAMSILDIRQPQPGAILDSEFGIREINIAVSRVRFGQKFRDRLTTSQHITCVTNANLTGLETKNGSVVAATVTNFAGQSSRVRAKCFVLAMGGIENSRMLLWCNHQMKGKLVDARAPIGRYWMEHLALKVGYAVTDLRIARSDRDTPQLVLGLTDAVKRKLSVLDCSFVLEAMHGEGTKVLIRNLLCVAPRIGEWAASLLKKNITCGVKLSAEWEQEPISSNHVKLSETKRDRFGIPFTELHWKKTDRDFATMQRSLSQLNDYLMLKNRGRINVLAGKRESPQPDENVFALDGWAVDGEEGISFHHMGGTRMGNTAEDGVVDSNCRVFGQGNLYVAGSSVFPSGGAANPTLTIVQLALRLAEYLRSA